MRFYRPLMPIAALTFDLDDTLYDNRDVIEVCQRESLGFIQSYHPRLRAFQYSDLARLRQKLLVAEPEIYHDVSEWRRRAIILAMQEAGLAEEEVQIGAAAAMENFTKWRNRIHVSGETHQTLTTLADKWPLAAITNGNAEPHLFGLDGYFKFILQAGKHGRAKPYDDMYQVAAKKLGLPVEEILHVGDDLITDVAGALRCGMQACWINPYDDNLMRSKDSRLLPHLEISQLASLTALI